MHNVPFGLNRRGCGIERMWSMHRMPRPSARSPLGMICMIALSGDRTATTLPAFAGRFGSPAVSQGHRSVSSPRIPAAARATARSGPAGPMPWADRGGARGPKPPAPRPLSLHERPPGAYVREVLAPSGVRGLLHRLDVADEPRLGSGQRTRRRRLRRARLGTSTSGDEHVKRGQPTAGGDPQAPPDRVLRPSWRRGPGLRASGRFSVSPRGRQAR